MLPNTRAPFLSALFLFAFAATPATSPAPSADITGTWSGTLAVPGEALPLVLHITRASDGTLGATLDSPSQGASGIPVTSITATGGVVEFTIAKIGASYRGTIGATSITGTFSQGGLSLPLTFIRGQGAPVAQPTPYPTPLPHFTSTDVTFASSSGAVLAGTITVPDDRHAPLPAFVLVPGSGPDNRDERVGPNAVFLDLSNSLSNAGIVVLRYDKRGIGRSTGTPTEDWHVLGDDVRAAVAFLRRQPEVDPNGIFLLGHSEGGLIVPLVAPSIHDLAGIVLMAPPAVPIDRIIEEQSARMTPAVHEAVLHGLASYLGIDPAKVIADVDVPILILQGTHDLQVLPSDLRHLTDAAHADHKRLTVDLLSGDDHLFLTVPPGEPSDSFAEYAVPAPLDPRVAADILSWMGP